MKITYYSIAVGSRNPRQIRIEKGLPIMKLAVRIIALSVVFVGVAAASVSRSSTQVLPSHQSATASNPMPLCGPGMPGCPQK